MSREVLECKICHAQCKHDEVSSEDICLECTDDEWEGFDADWIFSS